MSFPWCDSNIHTTVFTPRDHQVELLSSAFERNTMICLGHKSSKEFIAMKLLQEMYRQSRTDNKLFLYVTQNHGTSSIYSLLKNLTGLTVYEQPANVNALECLPPGYKVYIVSPSSVLKALASGSLSLTQVLLMVLEDCHLNEMHEELLPIFDKYYNVGAVTAMPQILGLAGPIHSAACGLEELSTMIEAIEKTVHCRVETASDIVTVLRYCAKPNEFIIQCAPYKMDELSTVLEDIICTRIAFLRDHRYDPSEIYNTDEYLEELKEIPDPKKEPLELLNRLLSVLHELGPLAADRLCSFLYFYIEKQKIKTPHERHYILLCMVSTVLSETRSLCEQTFRQFPERRVLIEHYSSPKVLKLLQILRLFKPEEFASDHSTINKINMQLEQVDFHRLTRSLDQTCHSVENILTRQQLESRSIVENLDPIIKPDFATPAELRKRLRMSAPSSLQNTTDRQKQSHSYSNSSERRSFQPRTKRRPFARKNYRSHHDSADTLCGLIFCDHDYIARILYDLILDMSRSDATLKYIKCNYTMERVADPLKEPKEAEIEHRRQEDVLKRFRMHDCNLLITTPVLEEGIDVPKCNLVVRWDPPTTYRSYVQCKGRARAAPAYHIVLVAPKFEMTAEELLARKEMLSSRSHRKICENRTNDDQVSEFSDTDSDEGSSNESSEEPNSKSGQFKIASSKGTVKILNPEIITDKPPTTTVELKLTDGNTAAIDEETRKLSLFEIKEGKAERTPDKNQTESCSSSPRKSPRNILLEETCGYEIRNVDELLAEKENSLTSNSKIDNLKDLINGKEKEKQEKMKARKEKTLLDRCQSTITQNEDFMSFDALYEKDLKEMEAKTAAVVKEMAYYREIEKLLLLKCANTEPPESEHQDADLYTACVQPYKPVPELLTSASVDLSTSIALINKYCSKLPSDTFTKLTALWRCSKTVRNGSNVYQCTLRLPINSPLKYDIVGVPMNSQVLARRMVALQGCMELHKMGELDDNLQPIGKEGFRAIEPDWETFELEEQDERRVSQNFEPRPGTTKRRQYYYKRIASEFCNCRPTANTPCYLYYLDLTLQCPIPEEQNTRGRRIYPPEEAQQGFGILTLKKIPKVSSFPIFTRSGEVKVAIQLAKQQMLLTEEQIRCINTFLNYTFTNVLRLQKFLMLFDPESTENCVFIVPTMKRDDNTKVIDWDFLRRIEQQATKMPTPVPEEQRKDAEFEASRFKDAVVMPWYRNQDQPQYFYVAEICPHLSPLSCFPGESYQTFKHYYYLKYQLNIQDCKQPLLDVDHTSARLNFLTPRYVNRKGVALPTSSEETKRAKRENLEQKQILVPELCTVHPFPASLWRTAVCLPCILYRINGLLLADEIRKKVSMDIGLGQQDVPDDFEWAMLDFGWSLSEVLRKSKENKLQAQQELEKAKQEADDAKATKENAAKVNGADGMTGDADKVAKSANEIVIEGEKKLHDSSFVEIGTWSNDMASNIDNLSNGDADEDEEAFMKYLPPNVSFCEQTMRYGSPTFWDVDDKNSATTSGSSAKTPKQAAKTNNAKNCSYTYYDSEDSLDSNYETGPARVPNYYSSEDDEYDEESSNFAFTSKNEAETIETNEEREKRQKQLSIIQATKANERTYQRTKNLQVGYDYSIVRRESTSDLHKAMLKFHESIELLKETITNSGMLVKYDGNIELPKKLRESNTVAYEAAAATVLETFKNMLPYADKESLMEIVEKNNILTVDEIKKLNLVYVSEHPTEIFTISGSGSAFDNFNDYDRMQGLLSGTELVFSIRLNFDDPKNRNKLGTSSPKALQSHENNVNSSLSSINSFSFDYQPDLRDHPGPSPSIILQGLTMSNANDGINLERLETIGDSFLKYAITTYLYITYENVHEGKLSHLRSKQVANLNLYRLGRRKVLGEYMIATKFEPHDNWLPPCYYVPKELEKELIEAKVYTSESCEYCLEQEVCDQEEDNQVKPNEDTTTQDHHILQIPPQHWKLADLTNIKKLSSAEICALVKDKADSLGLNDEDVIDGNDDTLDDSDECKVDNTDYSCFIPYNLVTQHSIPDKSVADCVEALIGAYLIECGSRGALLFMAWLGIRVLPMIRKPYNPIEPRVPGSTLPDKDNLITVYGKWAKPKSPLLNYSPNASSELEAMLKGFDDLEQTLCYKFRDRSYLLQAMTHASYSPNRLTDCYQRLEFLGDAVLDYLITRHLYEDPRQHSPGALTDLRSALVNNTIFASLAVRHGFHKYFRHLSPGLNDVIDRFVRIQNENGHCISEEYYLLSEEECDDAEDVEVPKALGDVFESIAGAIFMDSGMSLDVVWKVYSNMMKPEIEQFSNSVPKSPIRELLELEPETAKFGKPEKLADGRRVRVTVDVFSKGVFRGIGRNYRIAKCTAAKCALRQLKKQGFITKKD